MSHLIVGCGYLGHRLARQWKAHAKQVFVTTRRSERAAQFRTEGFVPIQLDVTKPPLPTLPNVSTVVYCVGYEKSAFQSIRDVYVQGLEHFLESVPASIERFIYISSTGVYGQTNGDWVDEDSPCRPIREGGAACFDAETILRQHALGNRAVILRLAGIYGPGRIPRRSMLENQVPLAVAADGYLNLIHVDDAVQVIAAADRAPIRLPNLYVVSDGKPVRRREYYEYLATLLNTAGPRFETPPPGSHRADRALGDKRIRSTKMTRELSVSLAYPSYCEGLAAIVRDEAA